MLTYQDANKLLQGRCHERRKVGNNTWLERHGDYHAIRLHRTIILRIYPTGWYQYFTGGWRTITTSRRMNEYGPASIHSHRNTWYIDGRPFTEGCTAHDACWRSDGTWSRWRFAVTLPASDTWIQAMRRSIRVRGRDTATEEPSTWIDLRSPQP